MTERVFKSIPAQYNGVVHLLSAVVKSVSELSVRKVVNKLETIGQISEGGSDNLGFVALADALIMLIQRKQIDTIVRR